MPVCVGALMISASVQTHTVSAYTPTDPANAVSPKPYPASTDEMISRRRGSRCWMKRVTGICMTTISTPFTAMAVPKSELDSPSVPMATGSPT